MRNDGYEVKRRQGKQVALHRMIMEEFLGRKLEPWEHVHHKDGNKLNNNVENLAVVSPEEHARIHHQIDAVEYRPHPIISSANSPGQDAHLSKIAPSEPRKSNSMAIEKNRFSILWRPNNYRRKIAIPELDNSTRERVLKCYSTSVSTGNHNGLLFIRHYPGVILQVGRRTVTAIWSQVLVDGVKQVFHIKSDSIEAVEERIGQHCAAVERQLDDALSEFCKTVDVWYGGTAMWDRYEDWVKGEQYIDSLPKDAIIHDTYFKKVYGEGIEFKQSHLKEAPGVHMKNYLKNRALEDVAPQVAGSLLEIRALIENAIMDPLERMKGMVSEYPGDLFKPEVVAMVARLSERQRAEFSDWTFERFGRSV